MAHIFHFTNLGAAFAKTRATPELVIAAAQKELDDICPGDEHLNGMITFTLNDQMFAGVGTGDGTILIDTATYADGPVLKSGPFAGKQIMMPRPDSQDR